jgi:hypothetical protein
MSGTNLIFKVCPVTPENNLMEPATKPAEQDICKIPIVDGITVG